MAIHQLISRGLDRLWHGNWNTSGYFYGDLHKISVGAKLEERWSDLAKLADFRPTDRVLDVGCAEGLISLEVAKQVAHVDAFDGDANRIERAHLEAAKRQAKNISFKTALADDYPVGEREFDVVLFLNVLNDRTREGLNILERLCNGAKRQIFVRANVQKYRDAAVQLNDIQECMENSGFDCICFSGKQGRGNLIVGSRRGTDARLRTVPPLVLVPAARMLSHPCLRGAKIGSYEDFR